MLVYKLILRALSLFTAFALIAPLAPAQARSAGGTSLQVAVVDPRRASIVTAQVRLISADGKEKAATTDERGEALFVKLSPGEYRISVEAAGFEAVERTALRLQAGSNRVVVQLDVAGVKEEVAVEEDEREKSSDTRGNAFSTVLTAEQIAELPDDPDEFEAAVRQLGGPGAMLRVNGFRGGKLPPKSQIREIRYRMNPYAAENHDASFMGIDILTKPGVDAWHSSLSFGFRDESLNARNAFAPALGPEQHRRFGLTLDGPLWKDRTSLFLSLDGRSSYDSKTIFAALPEGGFTDLARRPARTLNLSGRVEHALTKTHTLRAEYQRNANRQDNLGVGDFDLPERAYFTDVAENLFRVSDSGLLTTRLVNEFRFQARWQDLDTSSADTSPAILVAGAFNAGGAQVETSRRARDFELADNVDFVFGKHSMKAGIQIEGASYDSRELRNGSGTFIFASLEDFRRGRPTTFTRRQGDPAVEFDQYQLGWYWQDDMRVNKSLSLNFGIRHEVQTNLGDRNNFAPRFGLAWSPFKDGMTTLRAGAGIFYDWFTAQIYEQVLRVDGSRQTETVIRNPGYPDPLSGGTSLVLPPSRIESAPDLNMPYVEQLSFGMQRQFSAWFRLMSNYIYQRGIHLLRGRNINAFVNGLRPDPLSGNVTRVESTAGSSMHGLSINVGLNSQRRRLFANVGYFLSKSVNEADGAFSLPANNLDLRAERGPSPIDACHRLFGMLNMGLFKGLRVGTVFRFSTATPYNITTGFDDNGDTVSNDRPQGVGRNSARGAAQWDVGTRLSWGFGFGERKEAPQMARRPVVIRAGGDGDALSAMPAMGGPSNKRWRTEFYVQAYNLFNHVNRINFSGVQTSPFYGQATAALPGRRMEAGMKFSF